MSRSKDKKWKFLAFIFLTALFAVILGRITYYSTPVRGEIVLENQVKYYSRVRSEGLEPNEKLEVEKVSSSIGSFLRVNIRLPQGPLLFMPARMVRIKRIKVCFVPFLFENKLFMLGVYTQSRKKRRRNYFLEESSILTGERGEVSFVIFEQGTDLKMSLMSNMPLEELFHVARKYFMSGEK